MDELISASSLKILTPLLVGTTYISAFKNHKPTCDRYMLNYFLYLITTIVLYLNFGELSDKYGFNDNKFSLILSLIGSIGIIFAFTITKNVWLRHLLFIGLIFLLSIGSKKFYEMYDKEEIKSAIKKLLLILVVCASISIKFPDLIKPGFLNASTIALVIVLVISLIDHFIFRGKYNKLLSTIIVFIFTIFIIYDTNRVIGYSKKCKGGKNGAEYLDNVLDMFLNIINVFNNLLNME